VIHVLGEGPAPSRERVGGKALGLDLLVRAGARVPAGFCVTTQAFDAYLAGSGLAAEAQRLLRPPVDGAARARLSQIAHAAPLPDALRAALAEHAGALDGALAVRSSATDEDGAHASFAGAHESFLGVAAGALDGALRGCWASLWSERALLYRRRRGLAFDARMAVVVQALVPAVASAVAFGKHPVTGSRDELVVSCCPGLGEGMIAGGGSALTFVVARRTGEILELDGDDDVEDLPIADECVVELARIVEALEDRFGTELDVEAAHDGRAWWLVQVRAIST
jgi:phosphoenolpyruvate synthase/pyruvate phosphate dikinase